MAQETHYFLNIKVTWLLFFREMIIVYSENRIKHESNLWVKCSFYIKEVCTYSNHPLEIRNNIFMFLVRIQFLWRIPFIHF